MSDRRMTASEVKQRGWRAVVRAVREDGAVVVTNHNQPEAVVLGVAEYEELLAAARQAESANEESLEALRAGFDARLASLQAPDAAERLRAISRKPLRLHGKVKAGAGF